MVSGTLKLKQLFSWSLVAVKEGSDFFIHYYPDASTMLKIKLDADSLTALKTKRDQLAAFLEQTLTLSGTQLERWEKQTVTRTTQQTEWVRVA